MDGRLHLRVMQIRDAAIIRLHPVFGFIRNQVIILIFDFILILKFICFNAEVWHACYPR